jgi:hypothetical protein
MRQFIGLLLGISVVGCADLRKNETVDEILPDTIYDGNIISREQLEAKRPTIQLDNGVGEMPRFSIGDTSLLRIRIPRLTNYEMRADEIVGAAIVKVDTASNKFLVIPNDSIFSFVLMQHYPKGRVVRYTRDWNEDKAAYYEQITDVDGLTKNG